MNNQAYKFILAFSLIFNLSADAQLIDTIPDLPADELEVIKNFELQSSNISPLLESPQLNEIKKTKHNFNYDFQIPDVDFEAPKPQIKPLAYNKPIGRKVYDGFVDASFGTPNSPKIGLGYNYHVEDWYEFGLLADYYAAEETLTDNANHFDKTNIKAFGAYHLNDHVIIGLDAKYQLDNIDIFFFNQLPFEIRTRRFARFEVAPELTFDWVQNFGSNVQVEPYFSSSNLDSIETVFGIKAQYDQKISNQMSIDIEADYRNISFDSTFSANLLTIEPSLNILKEKFHLDLGAGVYNYSEDSSVVLPRIDFRYHLNTKLDLLAGVTSSFEFYDLESQYHANPFLYFIESSYFTRNIITPYLGAKFKHSNHSIELAAQYNFDENLPFWTETTIQLSILDRLESINYFSARLGYSLELPSTRIEIMGFYRNIDNDFIRNWNASASIQQNLFDDRIGLNLEYLANDGRFFSNGLESNSLQDINFKLNLNLNDRFTLYAQILNILDRRFNQVAFYSTLGRTFRGGVFVKF